MIRATEMRLAIIVQNQASFAISRIGRDLTALERASEVANRNQAIVQGQVVKALEKRLAAQKALAAMEAKQAQQFLNLQIAEQRQAERTANAIARAEQRKVAAQNAGLAKRMQMVNTIGRIEQMQGSGAARFGVQESQMATRRLQIEQSRFNLGQREMTLRASALRNEAQLIGLRQRLQAQSPRASIAKYESGEFKASRLAGPAAQQTALRLRAAAIDAQKIARETANIAQVEAIYSSQLDNVIAQEKLIAAGKSEQAAALGRMNQMLGLQSEQLKLIESRYGQIEDEIAQINAMDSKQKALHSERLAQLQQETAALDAQKIAVTERLAEEERLKTVEMQRAKIADDRAVAEAKLNRVATIGRSVAHVGRGLTLAGGIGTLALAATAGNYAEFNRNSAKAITQIRGVGESLSSVATKLPKFQKNIIDLTRQFPASAQEMTDAAYQIASGMDFQGNSTQRLAKTMEVLRKANQVAVAGQTDLGSATDSLVTILNNFDPHLKHVNDTINTMFATVRFGRGDFTQFEKLFTVVANSARQAGQSLTEAGGALAYLTTVMDPNRAAVGYARLLQIFGRKEFIEGFKSIFGVSATVGKGRNERLKPLSDLVNTMVTLSGRVAPQFQFSTRGGTRLQQLIPTITAEGKNVLTGKTNSVGLQGTIQAQRALTALITGWKVYRDVLNNVQGDTNEFAASLATMTKTPGVQWQITINQFKAFAIVMGQSVLPVMLKFMDGLANVAHWIEKVNKATGGTIGKWGAFASIGMLLVGMLATVAGSMLSAWANLAKLTLGLEGAQKAASLLRTSLAALGAIGAIVITVYFVTHFKKQRQQIFGRFDEWLKHQTDKFGGKYNPFMWPTRAIADLDEKMRGYDPKSVQKNKAINKAIDNATQSFVTQQTLHSKAVADAHTKTTKTILARWQELATQLTAMDIFKGIDQQSATTFALAGLALNKAEALGTKAEVIAARRKIIDLDQKQIKQLEKLPKTADNIKKLSALYQDLAQQKQAIASMTDKETNAQNRATKAVDRATTSLKNAEDRVRSLKTRIQELKNQAIDTLQSAFGAIGGGPISQGPIGQAFTQIASQLGGLGIPFTIPGSITLKDQAVQQKNFTELITDVKRLQKAGVAKRFTDEILQKGATPENLAMLRGVMQPGNFQKFVANLKQEGKMISQDTNLLAANLQLKAARINLKIAERNVTQRQKDLADTKTKAKTAKSTGSSSSFSGTRTTQSVTHNNHHVTIQAVAQDPHKVTRALNAYYRNRVPG